MIDLNYLLIETEIEKENYYFNSPIKAINSGRDFCKLEGDLPNSLGILKRSLQDPIDNNRSKRIKWSSDIEFTKAQEVNEIVDQKLMNTAPKRKGPPPTPMKKRPLSMKANAFLSRLQEMDAGYLDYGKGYALEKKTDAGTFMQVYSVVDDSSLIQGYSNEDILLKAFHETAIRRNPNRLEHYMKNSISQYFQLLEAQIPVAKILNVSNENRMQPIQDRFYIVERIPHAIDVSAWSDGETFELLPKKEQEQLLQVKAFFDFAVENRVMMDLLPQNIRYNDDNELFIIDFMEEAEEDEFESCLNQAIAQWSNGNKNIFQFLISNFQDKDFLNHIDL